MDYHENTPGKKVAKKAVAQRSESKRKKEEGSSRARTAVVRVIKLTGLEHGPDGNEELSGESGDSLLSTGAPEDRPEPTA
jgi:hypothetical protein